MKSKDELDSFEETNIHSSGGVKNRISHNFGPETVLFDTKKKTGTTELVNLDQLNTVKLFIQRVALVERESETNP